MVDPLISVENLVVRYRQRSIFFKQPEPAVNDVSFSLDAGRILGIVGESGSGKSTLLRAILRLIPTEDGRIMFDGGDWLAVPRKKLRLARQSIGVVPQNPFLSLSPRLNVLQILSEPITADGRRKVDRDEVLAGMKQCGLPGDFLFRRAHELSGGQAQRVAIARALMLSPKLLVLDEPTSALDISVQAQILNLLMKIQSETHISMIFVSHDLSVVRHISNDMLVMQQGVAIEQGTTDNIIHNPQQTYTAELLESLV